MVLAYLEYEALVCAGCGGYLPETTHADHEGGYVAGAPHRCHRCTAIEKQREDYEDAPHRSALVVWPAELRRRNG
ncbi:hypothetical protein [Amycolatopsis echigonensis]|uniref:Uncharacterized protein n=1 Tax=Amycolatopsis echigonensis TaxID=2576905 RepID=A0A8E1W4W6_9PSEU|nr:hypothetical protein [Amycolatopsis echigonensis]MBB2504323.1 hypothetical protein [Amycolatopsis echigonensis]